MLYDSFLIFISVGWIEYLDANDSNYLICCTFLSQFQCGRPVTVVVLLPVITGFPLLIFWNIRNQQLAASFSSSAVCLWLILVVSCQCQYKMLVDWILPEFPHLGWLLNGLIQPKPIFLNPSRLNPQSYDLYP